MAEGGVSEVEESSPDESPLEDAVSQPKICLKEKKITVVVIGRCGAGKSTLINKVFDVKVETGMGPDSVTKSLDTITYKDEKHGITVYIVDTIGLKENMKDKKKQLRKLSKYVTSIGEAAVYIYCLPIGPGTRFGESNLDIMKSLQDVFGKDFWRYCMVVLTCSNLAWDNISDEYKDQETAIAEYKKCITDYTRSFQKELVKLKAEQEDVKTVFEYDFNNKESDRKISNTLFTIPAGKKLEDKKVIPIPGYEDWKEAIFIEMLRRCRQECKLALLQYKYDFLSRTAITVGGAAVGGAVGTIGGPVGALAGIIIGGVWGVKTAMATEKEHKEEP